MLLTWMLQQAPVANPTIPTPNDFGGGLLGAVAYIIILILLLAQAWQTTRTRRLEKQWETKEKERAEESERERKRNEADLAERKILIDDLLARANRYEQTQSSLQSQIRTLTTDLDAATRANAGLQKRVGELEQDMEKAKRTIEQDAVAHQDAIAALRTTYEEQIAELRTQLQQQKNIVTNRDDEIAALKDAHAAELGKRDRIETQLRRERDAAREQVIALEARIVTLTEQFESAMKQLEQANARIAELEVAQAGAAAAEVAETLDKQPTNESEDKEEKPNA